MAALLMAHTSLEQKWSPEYHIIKVKTSNSRDMSVRRQEEEVREGKEWK